MRGGGRVGMDEVCGGFEGMVEWGAWGDRGPVC